MGFGLVAQDVEHHPGLDAGGSLGRIEFEDLVHVLAEIEHHGDVAALPCPAGPGSSRQDGGAEFSRSRDGRNNIVGIAGYDQANGDLTVVRRVGRVESPASGIEAHLSAHALAQLTVESASFVKSVKRLSMTAQR
jgi:hypothetical protein